MTEEDKPKPTTEGKKFHEQEKIVPATKGRFINNPEDSHMVGEGDGQRKTIP